VFFYDYKENKMKNMRFTEAYIITTVKAVEAWITIQIRYSGSGESIVYYNAVISTYLDLLSSGRSFA
jgi:hypothetical protein